MRRLVTTLLILTIAAPMAAETPRIYLELTRGNVPRECAPFEMPPCTTSEVRLLGPVDAMWDPDHGWIGVRSSRQGYLLVAPDGTSGATRGELNGKKWDRVKPRGYMLGGIVNVRGLDAWREMFAVCVHALPEQALMQAMEQVVSECKQFADWAMEGSPAAPKAIPFSPRDWTRIEGWPK